MLKDNAFKLVIPKIKKIRDTQTYITTKVKGKLMFWNFSLRNLQPPLLDHIE